MEVHTDMWVNFEYKGYHLGDGQGHTVENATWTSV